MSLRLAILVSFIALSATAQFPPPLTEELPVSAAAFGPASLQQHSPLIGSNGEISLVVWSDARMGGLIYHLFAARLDRDGTLLDPLGIPLGEIGYADGVFWNGQHFVVISSRGLGRFAITHVDNSGRIANRRTLEMGTEWRVGSTRGGNNARVVFLTSSRAQRKVRLFDGNLDPVTPEIALPDVIASQRETFVLSAISQQDEFLVVRGIIAGSECAFSSGCTGILSTRLDSSGRILSSEVSPTPFLDEVN